MYNLSWSRQTSIIFSAVACALVFFSSQMMHQASTNTIPPQGRLGNNQDRQERLKQIELRRAAFSKGKWMLQKRNVPFDPDMLIRPRWRDRLRPVFSRMPEMSAVRREEGLLSGVYMADTLSLPGEITTQGDVLILAREVVFDRPPVIRARGNVFLFFIEPPKTCIVSGDLRRPYLQQVSFYSTGGAGKLLPAVSWSRGLRRWVYADCGMNVNADGGPPSVDSVDGISPPKVPGKDGVAQKGADGTCTGDPNGQRGEQGEDGNDGTDGGDGAPGSTGGHATGNIVCDIPDGATGFYQFSARGHRGGKGGNGGRGGDGGDAQQGGKGGRGANCCPAFKGSGGDGGPGGRGGRGGDGGDGQNGGNGGNGKNITVTYPATFSQSNIDANAQGGAPGGIGMAQGAGNGGAGGPGGQAGDPAPDSFPNCGTSAAGGTGGTLGIGPSGFSPGNHGTNPGSEGVHGGVSLTPRSGSSSDDDGDGYSEDEGDCNDDMDTGASYYPNAPLQCGDIWFDPDADHNCNFVPDTQDCPNSPIIINFSGNLNMTSPSNGVAFDIRGDGTRLQLSWTQAGSDDSFLALDRNGNGKIDNGAELFGNHTPLGNGQKANNGFEALSWYDLPANGGDGSGKVDAGDAIYSSLMVWQDTNHNAISEPTELRRISAAGIASIEVEYHYSARRDQHGNEYRYRAKVFRTGEGDSWGHNRFAYDVFLASR